MKSKGFTLIELLIVIAIIGILASVVLGSLNTARSKATDAAIKANLTNLRGAASIWYDDNGYVYAATEISPKDVCSTSASTGNLFADAKLYSGIQEAYTKAGGASLCEWVATATTWAVAVQLKTSDGAGGVPDAWCVDSLGASRSFSYTGVQTIADAINVDACS